jgi:Mg2+ and Co2+ transporter CorA
VVQTDIDSLVQIHFSATSERTNATLQFLTVVSVIFLPLNLLAGIFGMNFEYLPLIHDPWAVWLVFGTMLGLALGLIFWSRRRHWIG